MSNDRSNSRDVRAGPRGPDGPAMRRPPRASEVLEFPTHKPAAEPTRTLDSALRPSADHDRTAVDVRVKVSPPTWQRDFARTVVAYDVAALVVSEQLHVIWGADPPWAHGRLYLGAAILLLGCAALLCSGAWDHRTMGEGTEEYSRLFRAFLWMASLTSLVAVALRQEPLRPYAFGVIPIAFLLAVGGRTLQRARLHRARLRGSCMRNVLAIGPEDAVADFIARTKRCTRLGWRVTGACLPSGVAADGSRTVAGIPVIGDLDSASYLVCRFGFHVVAVSPGPGWSSRRLHTLMWDLEGTGATVVVDPGLMEIASPRLRVHTLDGVPMLGLAEPRFTGMARYVKGATDLLSAPILLILASPLMIGIAVAIKRDGGPVIYRQQRVGANGSTFTVLKFRTMVADADRYREELRELNQGHGPLFKIVDDPRITAVGRRLRRHSLDELPQLFNVLTGSMSLVGPRPPLPDEIDHYDREAWRRMLVKPGMTGLWQVSGRTDLSWEASVRLDRRYVENWTLWLDLLIIWKTIGAVVRGSGAY